MKSGFSTLELIMTMTISAIIMTSLLQIYNQVSKNMMRVERFVFEDTQLMTLRNRFEKDLSGLSAIWFMQADVQAKQGAGAEQKDSIAQGKTSRYFYSVNKNGSLETLTFITTNALQSYGSAHNRFVRVVYHIEADPLHEGLVRLMRKEVVAPTEKIDEDSLRQGKFYELVGGIASLQVNYQLIDKIELQKQIAEFDKVAKDSIPQVQAKEEKKSIIRSVKQWNEQLKVKKNSNAHSNDTNTEELIEEEDLGGAAVPKFIEMKIVFGVTHTQVEKEYKLKFCVPSVIDNLPKGIIKQEVSAPNSIPKGAVKV